WVVNSCYCIFLFCSRRRWPQLLPSFPTRRSSDLEGAVEALIQRGTSLLPVGVTGVDGGFSAGETVDVVGPDHEVIGRGLARMSASVVRERMGRRGGDEVIHRDELAVFAS